MYCLVVLRQVHGGGPRTEFIPTASIDVALALVVLSLGAFVYYVNHVVHSIRIVSIIDAVAAETRAAIREVHVDSPTPIAAEVPDRPPDLVLTFDRAPGTIVTLDEDDMVDVGRRHRCLIRLVPRIGEYVPSGAPLAEVWGDDGTAPGLAAKEVLSHIGLNRERTMHQDVAFGFRQLVDIAEKALSPAVNDPTTAAEALDRIHDLLRRVAAAPAPSGHHRDAEGRLRLVHPVTDWAGLVALSCDEIRTYGGDAAPDPAPHALAAGDLLTAVDEDAGDPARAPAAPARPTPPRSPSPTPTSARPCTPRSSDRAPQHRGRRAGCRMCLERLRSRGLRPRGRRPRPPPARPPRSRTPRRRACGGRGRT